MSIDKEVKEDNRHTVSTFKWDKPRRTSDGSGGEDIAQGAKVTS